MESVISLATWLLMVNRSGLSVLQTVYTWVRENRHEKKEMCIPREVRRELLALSALLPLVEQKLTAGWHRTVYMVDASDEGGGICETVGTLEELMEEGRWSVRGGWSTFTGDPEVVELWRAQSPELERERYEVVINVPRGVVPRTFIFHHLYSGLRREGDLEWYLVRLGASRGLRVIVINYDLAYGQEFDLGSETVVERILEEVNRGRADGGFNGAPCSTWTRARFAPGGPPPLRDRDHPWGRPHLSPKERAHCELHSKLMRNGVEVLESISRARGLGANEHPADPGRFPFPSVYDTAFFQGFEKRSDYERVTFPQCMLGAVSLKPTTLSVSRELNPLRYFGDLKCCHGSHQGLIGLDPETGRFRTREAQTYPPPFCERIATMFIDAFEMRGPLSPDLAEEENDELNNVEGKFVDPEVGDRVPVPEVAVCWDEIER